MSEKKPKRYTITAALLYANGPAHVGHLAGCYIPADIYARYLRLKGEDVLFVSGSDEHGVPITIRADKEGTTPKEIIDKYHHQIKDSFDTFGLSFDIYSRTSLPVHHKTSADFFKTLYDKNEFLELETEQYFDEKAGRFLADRYIQGTCPICGNENAYGDQCERCGSSLSPQELINPHSMLSGGKPILKPTKQWYLPFDRYQKEWLEEWINTKEKDWKANVFGQCQSWLKEGLKPRAMTRDLDWGVPVPLPNTEGKVLYVWFDAPIGYISASKDYFEKRNENENAWEKYWRDEDTKLVHFIGKDNIVFHCIIFPAMLKAEGSFILPENVPANEFMNLEGDKISTSRNWAVWLHEYLEEFPGKQDVLRYSLISNMPEQKDSDFRWIDFQTKNDSELVGNLGNFFNRAIILTEKSFDGIVPVLGKLEPIDEELMNAIQGFPDKIAKSIENYRFREALTYLMELASVGNKYLQENEPWKLKDESQKDRVATILHLSLQIAANLAILSAPFLPFTAKKMQDALGVNSIQWKDAGSINVLKTGNQIQNPGLLFEKIEPESIKAQLAKLENIKKMNEEEKKQQESDNFKPKDLKPEIQYDDFAKLDIRISTILEAERVKGSKKLLKLKVDTGLDERTGLSGIGENFTPEEVIGKQVCLLVNLAPRKMMGFESQGMILMASDKDGTLAFLHPSKLVVNGGEVS